MSVLEGDYTISDDKALLQFENICSLLATTYWAKDRPKEAIQTSIDHSVCFGVYLKGEQVGFARVVTDYATVFYIADVIISEAHRAKGLGRALIGRITQDERFKSLLGLLATTDAHGLYELFGFRRDAEHVMMKPRAKTAVSAKP